MNRPKRPPLSLAERRRLKMEQNKIAARQIRRTLIVIAILAGCWFLWLFYKDKNQKVDETFNPIQETSVSSENRSNAVPDETTLSPNDGENVSNEPPIKTSSDE